MTERWISLDWPRAGTRRRRPAAPPPRTARRAQHPRAVPVLRGEPVPGEAAGARGTPSTPWSWSLKHAAIQRFGVQVTDETPDTAVSVLIDPIDLAVDGLSSTAGTTAAVRLKTGVGRAGSLKASGRVGVNPLAVDATYDVQTVDLVPFQPYIGQFVNIALSGGQLSLQGSVGVAGGSSAAPQIPAG